MIKILNKLSSVILMVILFQLTTSCKEDVHVTDPMMINFELQKEMCAVSNDEVIFKFEDMEFQIAYSADKRMYMMSDLLQTKYYMLNFEEAPTYGQTVGVTVKSVGLTAVAEGSLQMKVIQEDGDKLWIWDSKNKLGFVLMYN